MSPTPSKAEHTCPECGRASKFAGRCMACIASDFNMDDDDDFDPEGPAFECAGFNDGSGFYCPLWGSEECDWECPEGGLA